MVSLNTEKLKELRKGKGLSTVEFAKSVHVSQQMMSFLENGDRLPSLPLLAKIIIRLDCNINDLVIIDSA